MDIKYYDLKSLKTSSRYINILEHSSIQNMEDFFLYMPRDYEDRTEIKKISEIIIDWTTQTVKWVLLKKNMVKTPKWKTLIEMDFEDELWNRFSVNFLNNAYILKTTEIDKFYNIIWKPKIQRSKVIFWNPKLVLTNDWTNIVETWRIYPIYPELLWIKPSRFSKKILENIDKVDKIFPEYLPSEILKKYDLMNLSDAVKNIHFPENSEKLNKAQYRIYFDKLLLIQLISKIEKEKNKKNIWEKIEPKREIIKNILKHIPFTLTNAQKKAIKDCILDMSSWLNMSRLVQWDVGSWKTIVATILAYYINMTEWKQTAFLAPTEVLANQHFININKILLPLWIKVDLLTWSTTPKNKEKIKNNIKNWSSNIIVWTTAIIQEDVDFFNLWLVVIDEQHKFWVKQRGYLKKFNNPHILQMTATPIPRSLAIAFFWEFDMCIIDELPAWRKPIYTKIIKESEINKIKPWVIDKINQWQQAYIITPLIEESEKLDNVASAMEEYQNTISLFNEIKNEIWLLHWKMSSKEKDDIMKNFKNNKIKILVSTTVIEVWVDSPTATIIIIKNSERFWLSQLHQLRWRVWRSDLQSYCFLITNTKSQESINRLKNMEKISDWFKLSEIDLETRWSWEILWIRQSWQTDIPIHILTDTKLLEKVQSAWIEILSKYENLKGLNKLKSKIKEKDKNILS